jgi:chromosomal replication initiation ATPase DnaA
MASQLPLPLPARPALSRADLIVTEANREAVAFIEAWPDWPVPAAAIYGPQGCGKSHLAAIWREKSGARVIAATNDARAGEHCAVVIEGVDGTEATIERDRTLFAAIEAATPAWPVLFTGRRRPAAWVCVLPDLSSRFAALAAFPLWRPDEALLASLARKLFADRQLVVPDAVIEKMLLSLERAPGAFRDFIARADAKALAESRPINVALVRDLLAENGSRPQ